MKKTELPLHKNDEFDLEITAVSSDGVGIGRHLGVAVFVPHTAVGDTVRCHIIKVTSSYAVAKCLQLLSPSPQRIADDCAVGHTCGGCVYRHVTYAAELEYKRQRITDAFARIGGVSLALPAVTPSPLVEGYRNKAILPIARAADGSLAVGYYAPRSHRVCDAVDCRLMPQEMRIAAALTKQFLVQHNLSIYDEKSGNGLVRALYLRRAHFSGQMLYCLIVNGKTLPHAQQLIDTVRKELPCVTGILLCVNQKQTNVMLTDRFLTLWGQSELQETLCGKQFTVSPLSFWQVNSPQTEQLYAKAAEFAALTGRETVLDLYCGTGSVGLSMAEGAEKLIGAEIVDAAVQNARHNAAQNGVTNAEFLCADAAKAAALLAQRGLQPDVVLLDPPRAGCDSHLIHTVCQQMRPARVVYISCDPATLARDCGVFALLGYRLTDAAAFDLFPRTSHVETVVCLKQHIQQ